jgi:hypothetical protein
MITLVNRSLVSFINRQQFNDIGCNAKTSKKSFNPRFLTRPADVVMILLRYIEVTEKS